MSQPNVLLADIGGTNARFAMQASYPAGFSDVQVLSSADYTSIFEAIDAYLEQQRITQLDALCFAVAGPVKNGATSFLNNEWSISKAQIRKRYGIENIELVNDFTAIGLSLARLQQDDLLLINPTGDTQTQASLELPETLSNDYSVAVLGPGTGLGVAGLVRQEGHLQVIASEGGHAGFAPVNDLQLKVLSLLQEKYGRVSNERLLSGSGLENIYYALSTINGDQFEPRSAADIGHAATHHADQTCQQSLALFFEVLGQVAGDVALTLAAYDGVFVGGGIVQRYPQALLSSAFRQGFEHKARYQETMEGIPCWLITHRNPGLLGASIKAAMSGALGE